MMRVTRLRMRLPLHGGMWSGSIVFLFLIGRRGESHHQEGAHERGPHHQLTAHSNFLQSLPGG
jgi:hypothetical protein